MANRKNNACKAYSNVDSNKKEELIRTYYPLVKKVVHRLSGRLPKEVDIAEMLNSGMIGLADALDKYDPNHETNFSTYAQFRIRGAILDSFRSQDWLPRSLRLKSRKIEAAFQLAEQQLGRAASEEEVAKVSKIPIEELQKDLEEVGSIVMLSFEELGFGHGDERFRAEEMIAGRNQDPLGKVLSNERIELVERALERLPDNERKVIMLYFYEELNLKEIGEILSVTESRASQIRSRALIRLKNYLKTYWKQSR